MLLPFAAVLVSFSLIAATAGAQEPSAARPPRTPFPIPLMTAPTLDGAITEPSWGTALALELRYEIRPGENTPPPVRSEVFLGHDEHHLYVAFRCHDDNPAAIRARFAERDEAFSDDWVGVVLDTFNDERRAYEFLSNPLGVQMDMLMDDVTGNEDSSWNAIWKSSGRITQTGYEVEIAIPFSQIRFQATGGSPQTWGVDLMRSYPRRDRAQFTLFPRIRGENSYLGQEEKLSGFKGIQAGQNIEIVPTFTAVRSDARAAFPDGAFSRLSADGDFGLSARWGITPNITFNGTINPDFSQIEADSVQLDVNNQFALFFNETRPFFLEGADFFATPRLNLLHTRQIVQPQGAAKITGKVGRHTFGVLAAQDETTAIILPGFEGSRTRLLDADTLATVGRYRIDVGENSTLGGMVTDRRGGGYFNNVVAIDGRHRFTTADSLQGTIAYSTARDAASIAPLTSDTGRSGTAVELLLEHSVRTWNVWAEYGAKDRDFRADLGFITQVDVRRWEVGGGRTWHGEESNFYNSININANVDQTTRLDGTLLEREAEAYASINGARESFAQVGAGVRKRVFNGVTFDEQFQSVYGEMRPSADIKLGASANWGDAIDFAHTRAGRERTVRPFVAINYGRHVAMNYGHVFNSLNVPGGRLFFAHVPELRVGYQHNVRTRLRAILQYTGLSRDPEVYTNQVSRENRDLFAQLLFSYKVNPQSAVYLGFSTGARGTEEFSLTPAHRTVFAKVSYAWLP